MRAGFYIDGFNLYHAIDELKAPNLKWVCYREIASRVLLHGHNLEHVKLFTALPTWLPDPLKRHQEFINASRARGVEVVLGAFKEKGLKCKKCQAKWKGHEEKESDVNLAIHLLSDSMCGLIDIAYLVTTDSDLAPAVRMVRAKTSVEVITVATPNRTHSREILSETTSRRKIQPELLAQCLMPKRVLDVEGNVVAIRPKKYDPAP
ncbi:MAG: NYN domain-containing protein [Armatimonadetes bacterium]|nr:NYN domain-containing protein [Armatimonadota bacterium]